MKANKKKLKDTAINVRLSTADKQKYTEEAKLCNMTLSKYVLHLLHNKKVTVIENGSEIAKAMYDLSETLNKCVKNPKISVEGAQLAVSDSVNQLKLCMEGV